MAYSPETPFEDLTDQQKIHHLFDVAYDASTYTHPQDYSEDALQELEERSRDSLDEFARRVMASRHQLHSPEVANVRGFHVVEAGAALTGTFHHVKHPLIEFTIDHVSGRDTMGDSLGADRLTIIDPNDPDTPIEQFERMSLGSNKLYAMRYRYPAELMTRLCAQLETIITSE